MNPVRSFSGNVCSQDKHHNLLRNDYLNALLVDTHRLLERHSALVKYLCWPICNSLVYLPLCPSDCLSLSPLQQSWASIAKSVQPFSSVSNFSLALCIFYSSTSFFYLLSPSSSLCSNPVIFLIFFDLVLACESSLTQELLWHLVLILSAWACDDEYAQCNSGLLITALRWHQHFYCHTSQTRPGRTFYLLSPSKIVSISQAAIISWADGVFCLQSAVCVCACVCVRNRLKNTILLFKSTNSHLQQVIERTTDSKCGQRECLRPKTDSTDMDWFTISSPASNHSSNILNTHTTLLRLWWQSEGSLCIWSKHALPSI